MATLTPAFRKNSGKIHADHVSILAQLDSLERSLEHLEVEPHTPLDAEAPRQILTIGRQLVRDLPEHCREEEETMHGPVGQVSAELAEFCAMMHREHEVMNARLWTFAGALEEFQTSVNRPGAIAQLRKEGRLFVHELRRHIELEETELSGFL